MPPRPARPLSTLALLKALSTNPLSACDEELFDELFVARRYFGQHVFVISDPAGIKHVLLDNFDNYPRVPRIRRLFGAGVGTGTFASEGETWRRHRRAAAAALDHRALAPDVPAMIGATERLADSIETPGAPFDLEAEFNHLLVLLFNRVLTGGNLDAVGMVEGLAHLPPKPRAMDFLALPRWLTGSKPLGKVRRNIAKHDGVLYGLIDARRDDGYAGGRDAMWRLAHARDRNETYLLPRNEIRDEAVSIISAGAHTTVRALVWIWYLLALDPAVEAKLHAELDELLRGGSPTPGHLAKFVYTRQVIDETMRLYPPVPAMLRQAAKDDVVCGHRVPRKSLIAIAPWIVHRHRRLWPAPDLFDPERFNPKNAGARARLAYLPFSIGPRICVGAALAMTQILLVVAVLAQRFRIRLADGYPIEPVGSVTLRPKGGLRVTFERRTTVI